MTQEKFGQLVGVTQQAISQMVEDGILPRGASGSEWLLLYCARLREQAAGRLGTTEDGADLVQERALLARGQRAMTEIKLSELRGEVIRVDAVRRALAGVFTAARDSLMQIPSRLSPVLAAESDQSQVHAILAADIHRALTRLASLPQSLTNSADRAVAPSQEAE